MVTRAALCIVAGAWAAQGTAPCTRMTTDGQECAPRWSFEGASYAGCTLNNSFVAGTDWCVTSTRAAELGDRAWQEGWGVCAPGCVETTPAPCPRVAQSGARCRDRWEFGHVAFRGCSTHLGRAEWCAVDSAGADGAAAAFAWEYCKPLSAACRRGELPPGADMTAIVASPPPPPPVWRDTRALGRCQRVTEWGARCYDTWHYKGELQHQCTTTGSSTGKEWCATGGNRAHWDFCREGCVVYGTDCPRVTQTGARCLRSWAYHNTIFEGCTSEYAVYEWCVVDADESKPWDSRWAKCAPGCVDALPPSPPPAPNSGGGGGGSGSGGHGGHGPRGHGGRGHGGGHGGLRWASAMLVVLGASGAALLLLRRFLLGGAAGGAADGDDAARARGGEDKESPRVQLIAQHAALSDSAAFPPAYGAVRDDAPPAHIHVSIVASSPATADTPAAASRALATGAGAIGGGAAAGALGLCSPARSLASENKSSFQSAGSGEADDGDVPLGRTQTFAPEDAAAVERLARAAGAAPGAGADGIGSVEARGGAGEPNGVGVGLARAGRARPGRRSPAAV